MNGVTNPGIVSLPMLSLVRRDENATPFTPLKYLLRLEYLGPPAVIVIPPF